MIEVIIASESCLIIEGIKTLTKNAAGIKVIGEAKSLDELYAIARSHQPDVLIIDYSEKSFDAGKIGHIVNFLPDIPILAITPNLPAETMKKAINAGVKSHLLLVCPKNEITDAIYATAKGEKFFCGAVLDKIVDIDITFNAEKTSNTACAPVRISERELEIIKHIARGLTNKEIGNHLFISTHTVMTHRKNIMHKLGVNNTAGLVIYAVKEKLVSPSHYTFEQAAG